MTTTPKGGAMLDAWLSSGGRRYGWYAQEHPVAAITLRDWIRGNTIPQRTNRARIAEITGGAVPVDAWGSDQ